MSSGGFRRLLFSRRPRGDAKSGEPYLSCFNIDKDVSRFDVLVDQTSLVQQAHCDRKRYGELQELSDFDRGADQPIERLASRPLEHQRHAPVFTDQLERPCCPGAFEFLPQVVFVREPVECGLRRLLRSRKDDQNGPRWITAQCFAEDALPVPPKAPRGVRCASFTRKQPRVPSQRSVPHQAGPTNASGNMSANCASDRYSPPEVIASILPTECLSNDRHYAYCSWYTQTPRSQVVVEIPVSGRILILLAFASDPLHTPRSGDFIDENCG